MATIPLPEFRNPFSADERQQMLDDDVQCGKSVAAVLLSVVFAGVVAMIVTVLVAIR